MKKQFIVLILFFCCTTLTAQKKQENAKYVQGTIVLNDGESLAGLLRYDTKKGILYYQNEATSNAFGPRNVDHFSYYDAEKGMPRLFYSIEYEDIDNGSKRFYFFEVLEELRNFAVLAKIDRMEVKTNNYYNTLAGTLGFPTSNINGIHKPIQYRKQDETLYIFRPNGAIEPYLETQYIYKNNKTYVKKRVLQRNLLAQCFGRATDELKKFSSENKLSFDDKEDLLKIMAHYKMLAYR